VKQGQQTITAGRGETNVFIANGNENQVGKGNQYGGCSPCCSCHHKPCRTSETTGRGRSSSSSTARAKTRCHSSQSSMRGRARSRSKQPAKKSKAKAKTRTRVPAGKKKTKSNATQTDPPKDVYLNGLARHLVTTKKVNDVQLQLQRLQSTPCVE